MILLPSLRKTISNGKQASGSFQYQPLREKMPVSKRNRTVTLSKTKKKGREHKEAIANAIKQAMEDHSSAYVFMFENMRNQRFKEVREQLKSNSRLFLGSNKIMLKALGRSRADEVKHDIYKLSKCLCGDAGLLCTNLAKKRLKGRLNG
ncbi:mRNA turnover protein [Canna indica]|uniref:mRNA turnover protein n=1 Tax=Canna indica TaxID=4628 RepID=A0AAQ3KMM3_9LILI|nr:mRNA turnover protein [Canna indica]